MNDTPTTPTLPWLFATMLAACDRPDPPAGGEAWNLEAIAAAGVVGAQAESLVDGERVQLATGLSDIDAARPVRPGDRFRIASTTKTFVAVVVLALVDEGTLSLDDRVEDWLPGVVQGQGNDGTRITIRQLLQHTSGIPNHVDDQVAMLQAAASAEEVAEILHRTWTPEELVALAMSHPPSFAPGDGWAYTDTGYVLAGMIVEAATGRAWAEEVAARIVTPLGLTDTFSPGADLEISGVHMRGYAQLSGAGGPVDVTAINPTALDAAGALVSTPTDLGTFFTSLMAGELLSAESLMDMRTTVPTGDPAGTRYGLGIAWVPTSCGGAWMHGGDTLGYHTRNAVDDDGVRAITIALTGDAEFEDEVADLVDAVLCPEDARLGLQRYAHIAPSGELSPAAYTKYASSTGS